MTSLAWRPRHDDPLLILAMDHRGSFGKTLFDVVDDAPTDAQRERMVRAKGIIYRGLLDAAPKLVHGRPGVLVDEQYGQAVIDAAEHDPVVLAVPVEASGHDWFQLQWGQAWLEHVRALSPAYAKVLVRDNPSFDAGERHAQLAQLATVSAGLHSVGIPLLYELLVPATDEQSAEVGGDTDRYDSEIRPGLVVDVIAQNQAAGVEPALWKIEGLETVEAARAVAAQARAGGRDTDLIVLGRDAPAARLHHWLDVAREVDAFVGFAIGRSIWEDTVRDWVAGAEDDDSAAARIAATYLDFATRW